MRFFYLMSSLIILLLTGCNNVEVEDLGMNASDTEVENAKIAIENVILSAKTKSGVVERPNLSLRESKVVNVQAGEGVSTDESIKLFVFDYVQGDQTGFAIASGDERINSAYAIVEKGSLADTTFNYGLKLLLDGIPGVVKNDLKQLEKAGETQKEISPVAYKTKGDYSTVLLRTQWGQRDPYNRTCRVDGQTCIPPAGCTAIALAQVIAYFNKPSSRFQGTFDYMAMTSKPSAKDLTCKCSKYGC